MPEFWSSSENLDSISMPTAIVRAYTSKGFAIAAGGRGADEKTRAIFTDNAQKIFPTQSAWAALEM